MINRLHNAMAGGTAWYAGQFPMSTDQLPRAMTGCFAFDGVAAYIDISAVAATASAGAVSWGFWAKKDGAPVALEMLLAINDSAGGNVLLHRISIGDLYVTFFSGVAPVAGTTHATTSCVDNDWHHHCVTWDAGGTGVLLYYLDGVLQFTSDPVVATLAADNTWSIGMEYDGAVKGDFFDGRIARVSVYARVLTASDVADLHSSPLPTTPAALGAIAVYAPGTHVYSLPTISDESGNAFNGGAVGLDLSDYVEDYPT